MVAKQEFALMNRLVTVTGSLDRMSVDSTARSPWQYTSTIVSFDPPKLAALAAPFILADNVVTVRKMCMEWIEHESDDYSIVRKVYADAGRYILAVLDRPEPEPEYEMGRAYVAADHRIYYRVLGNVGSGWHHNSTGIFYGDAAVPRPLFPHGWSPQ